MCINWIALGAVGTLLVVIITAVAVFLVPWRKRPRFSAEYRTGTPCCREASSNKFNDPDQIVPTYWIRLKIRNSGKSGAKRCSGKLVKVMDRNGQEEAQFDSTRLHWVATSWREVPFRDIDLGRDDFEYLDVLATQSNDSRVYLAGDQFQWATYEQRGIINSLPPGRYILCVTLYGDNVEPQTKYISLVWNGANVKDISVEAHDSLQDAKSWLRKAETAPIGEQDLNKDKCELESNAPTKHILYQAPLYASIGFLLAQYNIKSPVHIALAIIFLVWAIILGLAAYNIGPPRKIVRVTETAMEFPTWVSALTTFVYGWVITLVSTLNEGIHEAWFRVFYVLGFILLLILGAAFIYAYCRRRQRHTGIIKGD